MVGLRIRGRHVAFVALGLGAAACQLALDFDYRFTPAADAGGVPDGLVAGSSGAAGGGAGGAGAGGVAASDGGAGGSAGNFVSEGNAGDVGLGPVAAGSGPDLPGAGGTRPSAGGASGAGGAPAAGAGGQASGGGESGGSGGSAEPPPPCTGCVEIIAAFSDQHRIANFQIEVSAPEPAFDFAFGTLEWRVQALSIDPLLGLKVSVQNGPELGYVGLYTEPEIALAEPQFEPGVWTTLQLDVGSYFPGSSGAASDDDTSFDKSQVRVLGLELGMRSDVEGPIELHLLIDRVTVGGVPGVETFELSDGLDGFRLELAPEGAQVIHHPEPG